MSSPSLTALERRTFLGSLALSVLAVPLAAGAQSPAGKVWRIGVLTILYPPDAEPPQALRQRLRELGYVEGQNIVIEWRDAQGNLLSNAIKFTPEGGRIEVLAVPKDGSVEVSVSDTGVGIAPEDQEAAFEEFRQVGTSAARQEGTGLGLALCRKFVELHRGKIRVQSEVGRGSTFTFTIPVR